MSTGFSSISEADSSFETLLNNNEELENEDIDLDEENILQELYFVSVVLKDKFSWSKNVEITNKLDELQRFKQKWEENGEYHPRFNFSSFEYDEEKALSILDELTAECQKIDKKTLRQYNVKELTVEDLRNLYRGIFEEFKLYVKLSANLSDRNKWKKSCLKIWPMDEEAVMKSKKELDKISYNGEEDEKTLEAKDLKMMWENELSRLKIDYDVEIRDVDGCFNIPEEQTVVVAEGTDTERFYSRKEAEMLTIHELFHVIRAYNGVKIAEKSGFPPILGVHTPFYDETEEGGAIYREFEAGVITKGKEKDYHLRALAAYYTYQDHKFSDIIEKLVHQGARPERAFALAARNREILRHHIYMGGYFKDWKENESRNDLLSAKVNREWAEKIREEIEAENSALEEPPVNPEQIFEYSFK